MLAIRLGGVVALWVVAATLLAQGRQGLAIFLVLASATMFVPFDDKPDD